MNAPDRNETTPTDLEVRAVASAIVNARGMRRGAPPITNVLDILSPQLRDAALDDARAAIFALERARGRMPLPNLFPRVGK